MLAVYEGGKRSFLRSKGNGQKSNPPEMFRLRSGIDSARPQVFQAEALCRLCQEEAIKNEKDKTI